MFLSSSNPGLRVLLWLHWLLRRLAHWLLLPSQWRQHQHLLLWRAGQQVLLHQQGPGGPAGGGGSHRPTGLHAGGPHRLSDGHHGRLPDLSLVPGIQEEAGDQAEEWVWVLRVCWQLEMDDLMAGATWNRLPHAESGGSARPGGAGGQSSQSLPSLYHCSLTPVTTRETVLHSPTLPHSLSDHIGELSFFLSLIKINDIFKSINHLKLMLLTETILEIFCWKFPYNQWAEDWNVGLCSQLHTYTDNLLVFYWEQVPHISL